MSKPMIIGLNNPYSVRADDALVPWPRGSAGERLFAALHELRPEITEARYVESFARMNLWRGALPRHRRRQLLYREGLKIRTEIEGVFTNVVCLGALVWGAIASTDDGVEWLGSIERGGTRYWKFPHPSGRNPMFSIDAIRRRAGEILITCLKEQP